MPQLSADQIKENYAAQYTYLGKNKLINGEMVINQRGGPYSISAGNSQFTLDRWQAAAVTTTGVYSIDRNESEVPTNEGFRSSMKIDCTTQDASMDSDDRAYFRQEVEGNHFVQIDGKACVLSFWLKSSKLGKMYISFRSAAGTEAYNTAITIADTNWNKYEIPITFDSPAGTWPHTGNAALQVMFVLMAGSSWQGTTDQWITGLAPLAGSDQTNFLDNTANNIWITGVQLEEGTVASEFEFTDMAILTQRCFRYFYRQVAVNNDWLQALNSTSQYVTRRLPVYMRTNPTITVYDSVGTTGRISYFSGGGGVDNIIPAAVNVQSPDQFNVTATGLTNNNSLRFRYDADAEL